MLAVNSLVEFALSFANISRHEPTRWLFSWNGSPERQSLSGSHGRRPWV